MPLPKDYSERVLNHYKKKLSEGLLHSEIEKGSPARLRDACLRELARPLIGKDEKLLLEFFEHSGDIAGLHDSIRHFDIVKLRPLRNFMRRETNNPDDNIVELLAWLTDFNGRPYDPKKDYVKNMADGETEVSTGSDKTDLQPPSTQSDSTANKEGEVPKPDKQGSTNSTTQETGTTIVEIEADVKKTGTRKKIIISIAITFAAGLVLFWGLKNRGTGHEACMCWTGDRYEPVSCRAHLDNALVIGLDSQKLIHFRKITRTDTITGLSIGSVWYANYKGKIECFTSDGFHPIDLQLRLKPITLYILRKYIWKQNVPGGDDSAHISSQ